jgi:hypothetical protein
MPVGSFDIEPIRFSANFFRYEPAAVAKLGRIERALGAIRAAAVIPPAADQMRASALAGTVHYSTLIEGNELPLIEAECAAAGELDATTAAKIELVNYVEALQWLDDRYDDGGLEITPPLLLALHGVLMRGLGREGSDFKPRHEGAWRDGRAVVTDELGRIVHEGSPAGEVAARMAGFCVWITERENRLEEYPPPVLAAVAHHAVTEIHPFANGNGRTARLLSSAVLLRHGYLPGRPGLCGGLAGRGGSARLTPSRASSLSGGGVCGGVIETPAFAGGEAGRSPGRTAPGRPIQQPRCRWFTLLLPRKEAAWAGPHKGGRPRPLAIATRASVIRRGIPRCAAFWSRQGSI